MTLKLILYSTYMICYIFSIILPYLIFARLECARRLFLWTRPAVGSWRMAATRKMSWALKTCL